MQQNWADSDFVPAIGVFFAGQLALLNLFWKSMDFEISNIGCLCEHRFQNLATNYGKCVSPKLFLILLLLRIVYQNKYFLIEKCWIW